MTTDVDIAQFVFQTITGRKNQVLDILEDNGIKNMEQYATLMGELNALNFVKQELSGLLEKQELSDD
jgi:hypothetical protein